MNSRHCPHCHCTIDIVKIGTSSSGRQRYRCKKCHKTWISKSRPDRIAVKIWNDFVWNNMPVRALSEKYDKHPNTIRNILHEYRPAPLNLKALDSSQKQEISVIAMDTTYFGRKHGVVTVVDAHKGTLLYFHEINGAETNSEYYAAIYALLNVDIRPKVCVIDGRKGVAERLEEEGILVQMCHFHMWQIVRRYLTNNPVLAPNIELKQIMDDFLNKHSHTTRRSFSLEVLGWRRRNLAWLNEKHRDENGRLEWSHADTRRAFNAIHSYYRWLFTYEDYPELNIPKTSNIIEGKFGNAKDKLRLHHGYTQELKIKIFFSLLSGRTEV